MSFNLIKSRNDHLMCSKRAGLSLNKFAFRKLKPEKKLYVSIKLTHSTSNRFSISFHQRAKKYDDNKKFYALRDKENYFSPFNNSLLWHHFMFSISLIFLFSI